MSLIIILVLLTKYRDEGKARKRVAERKTSSNKIKITSGM